MPTRNHVFPLDLTMKLDSNHVVNEVKQFTSAADRLFVPNAGPFYTESMVIKTSSGRLLQPITEYKLLYLNEEATLASNRNVCTVIQILNETIPEVHLDYRVIGGQYGDTVYGILQELGKVGSIVKQIDWKTNVYNKPTEFPPAPHFHHANDFTDWDKVWVELEGIRKAIIVGDEQSWASVFRYFNRRIEFVESNISDTIGNSFNGLLSGYINRNEIENYYTKAEVERLLTEGEVKLSKGVGNLLELREDGLYYGIQAPPNLSNIYVDAVGGLDTNAGTKEEPLKTLDKALSMIDSGQSNTIHLKVIPESHIGTHSYFVSRNIWLDNGVTRRITIYGHDLIDGEKNKEARRVSTVNWWYNTLRVPRVNVWIRWGRSTTSNNIKYQEITSFFNKGGTYIFDKINFIVQKLEDIETYGIANIGYSYNTVFSGSGEYQFNGCHFIKAIDTHVNFDNPDLSQRPAVTDINANMFWWFMSYGASEMNLRLLTNTIFTYATLIPRNRPNEFGHIQYGNVNVHDIYNNSAFNTLGNNSYKGKAMFEIHNSNMNIFISNNVWDAERKLYPDTPTTIPHNVIQWLSEHEGINRITWMNGVPVNIVTNFPIGRRSIRNNSNAYKVVNITTNMIPNDTRSILDLLMWRDGLNDAEFDRLSSGMSYYRITSDKLKVLNLDMEDGSVFGDFIPTGLQVTLYNATISDITVNQRLHGKNVKRTWLAYSAMTLIFINKTDIDVIGGMREEE